MITQGRNIVGGAQLLIRSLPFRSAFGYVPLGPVLVSDEPALTRLVVQQLHQVAREERIRFLAIQVPWGSKTLATQLSDSGFSVLSLELAPTASVLIDLLKGPDEIFSEMNATVRKHIRKSQHSGISVREGTDSDLDTFYRLLCATANRRGFSPPSSSYFSEVWRVFAPRGYLKLFVAEISGEPLSALLAIAFANIVTCWRIGWSGKQATMHPNEALHWAALQWAKSREYRYFDFGGISRTLAKRILAGEPRGDSEENKMDFFKLGFGGEVKLFPEASGYVYNPVLRWAWPRAAVAMTKFRPLRNRFVRRIYGN
jgi:lipid II:glycine glycyltransferase (peptidoglycan interpeptide bridge formation enzyme)